MGVKYNRKHGEKGNNGASPEYTSWSAMKARCKNPNLKEYPHYGGRGITVCESWQSYENFLADMGRRPTLQHTIDRIDVHQGYFKENCRWATAIEQANNRTRQTYIEIDGVQQTQAQWLRQFNVKKATFKTRLRNGWDVQTALTHPVRPKTQAKKQHG
jgi:hypothetical protein